MDIKVQAWMDALFHTTVSPPWDELVEELKSRYLPDDHTLRVERLFGTTVQTGSLRAYVEQFQLLEAAIILGGVELNDREKVSQFVQGLTQEQERYQVISKDPKNLKECYRVISLIRQARLLASSSGQSRQTQSEAVESNSLRHLHSLRHEFLAKFPDSPTRLACLRCGSKGHQLLLCPVAKQEWADAYSSFAHALVRERCNSRGNKHGQEKRSSEGARSRVHLTSEEDSESTSGQEEEQASASLRMQPGESRRMAQK
jgi:hypothetical protein